MRCALVAAVLLSAGPAVAAGSSAGYGKGGQFKDFDPVVAQYNASGELFRIQGHCQSSCTLFLGIHRLVCIERTRGCCSTPAMIARGISCRRRRST